VGIVAGGLAAVLVVTMAALIAIDRQQGPRAPFPWLWLLPAVLVFGLSLLVGVAEYPALPDQIPIHFDIHGVADQYAPTTPLTALFPVALQALLTANLAAAGALVLRLSPAGGSVRRVMHAVQAGLVLATGLDLALFLLAEPTWQGRTTMPAATLVGALASVAVGMAALVVTSIRARSADPVPEAGASHPALFVPKRYGVGWTLNLTHPAGWPLLVALLAVPLLTIVLGTLAV
jgi:hypothetical protein